MANEVNYNQRTATPPGAPAAPAANAGTHASVSTTLPVDGVWNAGEESTSSDDQGQPHAKAKAAAGAAKAMANPQPPNDADAYMISSDSTSTPTEESSDVEDPAPVASPKFDVDEATRTALRETHQYGGGGSHRLPRLLPRASHRPTRGTWQIVCGTFGTVTSVSSLVATDVALAQGTELGNNGQGSTIFLGMLINVVLTAILVASIVSVCYGAAHVRRH